ncbi:Non-canonical non-ribosomal peptide synthetase FUB8 [Fusarium oxysporum f. sp. rapae]|uniref:Non-canonical non-ribosomal peptide synthetase FUB8 n=1 Tax=Fusarium oxysporum f. sp. rapae TaxID=485398 RepID=A0A8J5NKJ5_FUSOX|nr:Non-canonical non-ribosomal peptide synthetase FUB8 [Fusarium oxysporum f. sp. rapae]
MAVGMATPANCGRRLIPQILDDLAAAEPDRIIYSLARSSDLSQGFRHVSARAFTKAVDKTAWLLQRELGVTSEIRAVGYIGPHDLRQILLTFACIKANCAGLFLSPKNSTEGALAVLEAANCNIWVNPAGERPTQLVNDFLQQRPMHVMELPKLDELLPEDESELENVEPFPYTKRWEDAINDTFCILHTSGSTGLSKPISWTHGLIGTVDAVRLLPPHEGMEPWAKGWDDGDTLYSTFPLSHGAGILMDVVISPLFGLHCVLGPRDVIPNLELISSLADHIKIDIWSMIPSLTDELGEAPDILPKLSRSKFICASGGPVSNVLGSKVNEFVRVLNLTGTSEGLFIGNLWVDRQDWHWFAFHPWSGFDFKLVEPGLYEQWIHRNEHAEFFQGLFHTFQDVNSFNFKDLYVQHPTKPGLWASHGRSDDVVVLSNGYKISPLDTEALVTSHPAVDGCLMIGSGKPQAGLLIELKDPTIKRDGDDAEALFNSIWAVVERANSLSLHKDQLHRDFIAFSEAGKPFIRTDKRTIKRRATMALYADYIERFYQSRGEDDSDAEVAALGLLTIDTASFDSTARAVRHILASIVPAVKDAPADANLFTLGFDSLLVFKATKAVAAVTDLGGIFLPRNFYAGPTVKAIAATVVRLAAERRATTTNGTITSLSTEQQQQDSQEAKIRALMNRHKALLSSKLGPMDLFGGNMYEGINVFIPLRPGVSFEQAYKVLQQGLVRAMEIVPALAGKVIPCSEHEIGYKKGDVRISLPPLPSTALGTSSSDEPRQLRFRDLSSVVPTYAEQRASGFLTSAYPDELLTTCPSFPDLPTDVLNVQANFVDGGCVLAFNVHHHAFDGIGMLIALTVWAECCRFVQGDQSATSEWLHPESLNRDMLSILYELEGFAKPASEVDPRVWGFLPYADPALKRKQQEKEEDTDMIEAAAVNGRVTEPNIKRARLSRHLPKPPRLPSCEHWPPAPRADGRTLTASTFVISAEKLERLQKSVEVAEAADPESQSLSKESGSLSLGDVLQAFFWRAAVRARRRAEDSSPDDMSIIEMPTDVRPYFSSHLPPTYMANCVIMNRQHMSVSELCSSQTSLYKIAQICREARTRVDQELVHDAFSLLHTIQDNSPGNHTTAFLGQGIQDGPHSLFNNMMLFQASDIGPFGGDIFEAPEAVRVQMDWLNKAFRSLFILPMRKDGGVELLLGTLPEELDAMKNDHEFMQFAEFLG